MWRGVHLNETREESGRESFLLKIYLAQSPPKSSFHQSFQFYVVESTMAFLWYLCGFREGTVDYFLYKLIKLAKFAIFLMELSLPAGLKNLS